MADLIDSLGLILEPIADALRPFRIPLAVGVLIKVLAMVVGWFLSRRSLHRIESVVTSISERIEASTSVVTGRYAVPGKRAQPWRPPPWSRYAIAMVILLYVGIAVWPALPETFSRAEVAFNDLASTDPTGSTSTTAP